MFSECFHMSRGIAILNLGNTNLENIHRMKYMKITLSATLTLFREARHSWRSQFLRNSNPKPRSTLATVLCFRKEVNASLHFHPALCLRHSCENEGGYFSVSVSSLFSKSREYFLHKNLLPAWIIPQV